MNPTRPPVSGGSPRRRAGCAASTGRPQAASGSPSTGTPTAGRRPASAPARRARSAWRASGHADERVPRPDPAVLGRLQQERPGRPPASLRYTPTGVSPSASSRRLTGITRRSLASSRKVSVQPSAAAGHGALRRGPRPACRRVPVLVDWPGPRPGVSRGPAPRDLPGPGRRRASSTSASKQVRLPVWQAGADLVDHDQHRVAVAVEGDRPDVLDVARGVALHPVLRGCGSSRCSGPWSACGAAPRRPSSRP